MYSQDSPDDKDDLDQPQEELGIDEEDQDFYRESFKKREEEFYAGLDGDEEAEEDLSREVRVEITN